MSICALPLVGSPLQYLDQDLNLEPSPYKRDALPLSYLGPG